MNCSVLWSRLNVLAVLLRVGVMVVLQPGFVRRTLGGPKVINWATEV